MVSDRKEQWTWREAADRSLTSRCGRVGYESTEERGREATGNVEDADLTSLRKQLSALPLTQGVSSDDFGIMSQRF